MVYGCAVGDKDQIVMKVVSYSCDTEENVL